MKYCVYSFLWVDRALKRRNIEDNISYWEREGREKENRTGKKGERDNRESMGEREVENLTQK